MKHIAACLLVSAFGVDAFSSTSSKAGSGLLSRFDCKFALKKRNPDSASTSRNRPCSRCPDDASDDDKNDGEDRREALFAMLGSLLASISVPAAASATYGADANIELPNPIEAIANRQNGQCLVESLGNRDCLVYLDPANKLYQGADSLVLLERMEKASQSLASIPSLIEERKWNQVTGVLLGPLGTMVETMNLLTKSISTEGGIEATGFARKSKTELNNMFQAVARKDGDKALAAHEEATRSVVSFIKSL